jgi:hypothetical protein
MTSDLDARRILNAVVCGAGPAPHVGELIKAAQDRGWTVGIAATPSGLGFLDVQALEELTGQAVRSRYRAADEPRSRSLPDAIVVAPATYNTICKLALGISDTYALGIAAEAIGRGVPVAVLPFVNSALASRRPFQNAVESLRAEGVRILLGPGQWEPHPPGTGGAEIDAFPWSEALDAAGILPA